ARAIASICCWPPESEPASWRLRSASTGKISNEKARFLPMSGRAGLRKAPSSRFSSTLSLGNRRRPSGTMATPRLTISSVDRRAFADDPAGVEADHALREAHHRLHDVLDHDDRDPCRIQVE